MHSAITRLQDVTGRTLTGSDATLILPSQPDGSGVDRLALTTSAGDDLNMVVMGLAYDFSKKAKYVDGVLDGANYIYGNNAMGQSYVTGYGSKPLLHPHHRFWSNQADARFPKAPPGCVSGGPNSGLQDPYVQAAGLPAFLLKNIGT